MVVLILSALGFELTVSDCESESSEIHLNAVVRREPHLGNTCYNDMETVTPDGWVCLIHMFVLLTQ